MTAQVIDMTKARPKRTRELVTGPEMILIFWIARIALEDRLSYDYIKKELNLKGDEAAHIYNLIRDFLGDEDERTK
jgi:hypothetical protein